MLRGIPIFLSIFAILYWEPRLAEQFSALDEQFMRRAMALATQAEQEGEVPVGAVLVKDGQVIAEGWNQSIGSHDATAHAEVQTLRKAGQSLENYRLLDTTLYVTLEPCPMCAGALLHSRVKRIVFGAPDLKAGAAGTVLNLFEHQAAYHYATVERGLLEDECREQLQAFFKRRRKEIKALKQEKGSKDENN
ncbi:tRNA adenosine(34) deaminase TadA [Vibrio fluminensis]|uniref:tRNA adenosine(34) deaminase TadA n=1 Tax=Vibrio fluminensis TaxID=2783614 RepID=UPI00188810A8|nr:tRNA adenosine(34) deaminase TadA [Vibrio fluminensis]